MEWSLYLYGAQHCHSPYHQWIEVYWFVPPISCFHFWHPLGCQVELKSIHQNCHLYCHVHVYLTGPLVDLAYTLLGMVELEPILSYHLSLHVMSEFPQLPLICYEVFSLIFAHAPFWNLRCERREKKLETAHITEIEVKWAGTVCFLSQQTLMVESHKWMIIIFLCFCS
jgi:hypothetical protein